MNRHVWQACDRAAGFSFVELLVTIVIAGIAFAAMVPMFVQASQKGAGDTARNVSLNLAQDKIEKIRQLDYDLLTEENLNSASFSGGGFGQTVSVSGGSDTRAYRVDYSVTYVGGTYDGEHAFNYSSGDKSEQYKLVSVDIYWTGNPKPVKHAVLRTIVYKQYAGSYINVLAVSPMASVWPPWPLGSVWPPDSAMPMAGSAIDPKDTPRLFLTSYEIQLAAYVNEADSLNTKNVTFTVYNSGGTQIAKLVRATSDDEYGTPPGTFTQTYSIVGSLGSQDGTYTFKATAISKRGYEGNTQVVTLPVETGAPPAPTGLKATAGNQEVLLSWSQSSTGDVVKYEVYRMGPTDDTYVVVSPLDGIPFVTGGVPKFTNDIDVVNGETYSYKVLAVDAVGNKGWLSTEVSETPFLPAGSDDVPPNSVTVGTAAASGTQAPPLKIRITWTGVTDPTSPVPKPTSGMSEYRISRSVDGGLYAEVPGSPVADTGAGAVAYTFEDGSDLKPLKTYTYKILAVDKAGNKAASSLVVSATTKDYQYCVVTVENLDTKNDAQLKVTNFNTSTLDTWQGITNPTSPQSVNKKSGNSTNNRAQWSLPVGFSFQAWYLLAGQTDWEQKQIPQTGTISSTTPLTISFGP